MLSYVNYMLKWSRPYINKYKFHLLLLFLLVLVSVGISLVQVNFVQRSIDAVMVKNWPLLLQIFLFFLGISALKILHGYLYGHYSNYVSASIEKDARNKYTRTVLNSRMADITRESSGDLITRHNDDIPVALGFIKEVYSNFLLNPLMAIGAFVYLLSFHWQLSLFVFLPVPITAFLLNNVSTRASGIYREIMESRGEFAEEIYDISHGMETIKAYSMQNYKLKKVGKVLQELFSKDHRYNRIDIIATVLIMGLSYLPKITALIYGGFLVMNGELAVSVLFAYYMLIQIVNTPTIYIFSSMHSVKNSYQSMKRLDTILTAEPERQNGREFPVTTKQPSLQFENVNFSYEPGDQVLDSINLILPPGKCIGIAGDSGAGKTTIVELICGFYEPDKGKRSVFGEDIADWELAALRSKIAYVSQDGYLLPVTLMENIRYSRLDASPEEVYAAAEKAGLSDFIDTLPGKLDTVLTENGANLSGGQRQRISLARAYLKEAPIYIFDEPTASLDPATVNLVTDSIRKLIGEKSVVIISHDTAILTMCDEIYLLRDGAVIEKGTPDELSSSKNYRELFRSEVV
ncbi:ABC transporter ATP-binding protein [Chloroflexota bacterium]